MTDSRIAEVMGLLARASYALTGEKPGLYWARSELTDAMKIVDDLLKERVAAEAAARQAQRDAAA